MAWRLQCEKFGPEYSAAVDQLTDADDPKSDSGSKQVFYLFIGAVNSLEARVKELDIMQALCTVCVSMQLFQVILYTNAHPRTAVLVATLHRSVARLAYLFCMLVPFFLFLAFVAFWMFGFQLESFATFGKASTSQLQMLYGHFIRAPGVLSLSDIDATMYWIHAVVFMVVVFFLVPLYFLGRGH
jgi:hypothetical protein